VGGAVTAVVVAPSDPAVIWAASSGGVFRSTDGGATWSNVSGPVADVARLAVHPQNPDKAWALSSSAGLYITSDGGATWTATQKFAGISATGLFVDPRDPDTLYVSGACLNLIEPVPLPWMGVHKSTDGGLTWTSIEPHNAFSQCVLEFAIDPFSPWRLFLSGYSSANFESYDMARTWERPNGPRPTREVIFDPRFPFTHYGISENGGSSFFVSQDGGFTWSGSRPVLPFPADSFMPLRALSIDPQRGRLFLATAKALFRSGDGGRSWAFTRLADVGVDALAFGGMGHTLAGG
jgi:photosystem II stability/assembly factor-like uncharacterized protein